VAAHSDGDVRLTDQQFSTIELDGVRFIHPPGWTREIELSEDGQICALQSTGVTFALVGVYPGGGDPDDMLEQALDSLRQEHPSLEVDDWDEADPEDPIQTLEAVFLSLDTVSYCWLRAWNVGARTVLTMVQSVEPEAERGRLIFRALCQSMQPAGEETGEINRNPTDDAANGRTSSAKKGRPR
jgi:hypothetical protein